jgi:hypothetical protein
VPGVMFEMRDARDAQLLDVLVGSICHGLDV